MAKKRCRGIIDSKEVETTQLLFISQWICGEDLIIACMDCLKFLLASFLPSQHDVCTRRDHNKVEFYLGNSVMVHSQLTLNPKPSYGKEELPIEEPGSTECTKNRTRAWGEECRAYHNVLTNNLLLQGIYCCCTPDKEKRKRSFNFS